MTTTPTTPPRLRIPYETDEKDDDERGYRRCAVGVPYVDDVRIFHRSVDMDINMDNIHPALLAGTDETTRDGE